MIIETNNYRRITVAEMAPHVHSFMPNENKTDKILRWLISWIESSLSIGKIKPYDLLPLKADLACHIGVSQGTIQNVFRMLENAGYVESKQKIGTFIKGTKDEEQEVKKLTSKRELAVQIVKRYILDNNYKIGDVFISIRKLASITGLSNSTLRLAIINLIEENILKKENNNYVVSNISYKITSISTKTLVEKTAESIKDYILTNFHSGDRLPSNIVLTKKFRVSLKTIHDSLKILGKEGFIYTRRGQYGTIVLGESGNSASGSYFYEQFEHKIRQYISENCQIGDKLPSIRNFAKEFNTSEKTVKKALDNLAEEGYITFSRGRYGGTFVMDIPQSSNEAYKWLAISPNYVQN